MEVKRFLGQSPSYWQREEFFFAMEAEKQGRTFGHALDCRPKLLQLPWGEQCRVKAVLKHETEDVFVHVDGVNDAGDGSFERDQVEALLLGGEGLGEFVEAGVEVVFDVAKKVTEGVYSLRLYF